MPADWYEGGLPFHCTGCGDCCTGAPGAVWVDDADLDRLATFLGLTARELDERHVRRLEGRRSLLERFDGDCEFFDREARGCRVYEARPTQCRTFPFWPQNLESPDAWQEVRAACEGARVDAPLVPVETVRERAAELRRSRERS
ncbi:MAG: YkgJ family cysteine cluster protein [Deltaproteobacteria bacterium]|nr:YkgJ family cysteine cluster protein [Deltaproteobacteria bacterium]